MKYSLLLIFSVFSLFAYCQTRPDTLRWNPDRPLRFDDFRGNTISSSADETASEFHYQIGYDFQPVGLGQHAIETFCLMRRDLSWMAPGVRKTATLRYFQLTFNLAELAARQLKARLLELPSGPALKRDVEQTYYEVTYALNKEVSQMKAETQFGKSSEALTRWEQQTDSRLAATPRLLTTFRLSRVGYGLFIGAGATLFTGTFGQHFGPSLSIAYGFDISYKEWLFLLHPTLTGGHVTQPFFYRSHTWEKGLKTGFYIAEIGTGRILFDSERFRLIPYVGVAALGVSPRNTSKDERLKALQLNRVAPTVGIIADFKVSNQTNVLEKSSTFIRAKLSANPCSRVDGMGGTVINLHVGFGGFGRIRKVSYNKAVSVPTERVL